MISKRFLTKAGVVAATLVISGAAFAQDTVKVGLILPMTGPFASTGRQVSTAAEAYMDVHGSEVAGKEIELIIEDDGGVPDQTKRIAQELVVNEDVDILAGFGLTPLAFATAPIASQAKVPMVVMSAGTSSITEKSPYIARTSFTLAQSTVPLAKWAAENDIKSVVTVVADYAPGIDSENSFSKEFESHGGEIVEKIRVPVANPDFAPFLQRVRDLEPDAVFVFVPSGVGSAFMKQFRDRGLDEAGIQLIGTGDVTDDDILNDMGDVAKGVITTHIYSAAHESELNDTFKEAFRAAGGERPNFMAVGGWDGMALIYQALEKTGGDTDGDALIEAMKGLAWESPRGPISIDPETRDIIQDIYYREVKDVDGELYNVEFGKEEAVKDPVKAGQ
ncbi:ABC transporter substrate-binding protein [Amorphus orientalis]|uniref:Branched-chain amino acid transport system substrate-binding protein n=1 Tax=Amorphus orientalis TaxID=649198 RepID=A0AAE4AR02_9HYPH|nr:ABC transporter substrate-binding protein [Amorphus orientalis]MDQ0313693.1 branched-chain amino acid transport system substrate-binding protein [Amorphus orientalis]